MILVAGHLRVNADERDAFVRDGCGVVEQARRAAGCLDFAMAADPVEPDRVVVLERWTDRSSLEAFRGSGPEGEQLQAIREFAIGEYDVLADATSDGVDTALAALPVRDMARAEQWYTRLLGTGPDARPMPGLVEWYPARSGGLQLVADSGRAGGGLATVQVADLAAFVAAAGERGVDGLVPESGEVVAGFATVTDPDGNAVTVVQT